MKSKIIQWWILHISVDTEIVDEIRQNLTQYLDSRCGIFWSLKDKTKAPKVSFRNPWPPKIETSGPANNKTKSSIVKYFVPWFHALWRSLFQSSVQQCSASIHDWDFCSNCCLIYAYLIASLCRVGLGTQSDHGSDLSWNFWKQRNRSHRSIDFRTKRIDYLFRAIASFYEPLHDLPR